MTRRLLIPWLMVILMEAVLLSLGVWQLQRRSWKEALIARMERNGSATVLALSDATNATVAQEYRQVQLQCRPRWDMAVRRQGFDADARAGERVYVPCQSALGLVVIDLGYHGAQLPQGAAVSVAGRLRFWEPQSLAQQAGGVRPVGPSAFAQAVAGFYVQTGGAPLQRPANNHFAYAVQWFAFAATLAVIFALWLRRRELAPPSTAA